MPAGTDCVGVLTADPTRAADLRRLVAIAGRPAVVAVDEPTAARLWRTADVVLTDTEFARLGVRRGWPRREHVFLIGADDLGGWQLAVAVGAAGFFADPVDEPALADRLAQLAEPAVTARVVAFAPIVGGAGASTLGLAAAVTAAAGSGPVAVVDADPAGGGLDLPLGAELVPGARWHDLRGSAGVVSAAALTDALPAVGAVRLLTGGRVPGDDPAPETVGAAVDALRRTCSLVVLDLPRHLEPVLAAGVAVDRLVGVSVADVRSAVAGRRWLAVVRPLVAEVLVTARVRKGDRLTEADLTRALGVPVRIIPNDAGLPAATDRGAIAARVRVGRLARAVRALVTDDVG